MKKLIIIFFILFSNVAISQQPIYSQYMLNPYLLNPSIAGYQGLTDFNLVAREQWIGYEDGPSTYVLSGQHRILKTSYRNRSKNIRNKVRKRRPSGRVAIAGNIYNDINGSIRRTGLQGTYAYHIYVRDLQFSMGVSLSMFQFKTNITQNDLFNPNITDPLIYENNSIFSPDANIGFLISSDNFYGGISVSNLFQNSIKFGNNNDLGFKLLRHYYIISGYKYQERRSDYAFEPSIMVSITEKLQWNIDLNTKIYFKENYWAGLSIRTSKTIISMFGMNYQNYYFGYAFDLSWGDISTFNRLGSHEIMIGMKLGDSARRYRWLNRF